MHVPHNVFEYVTSEMWAKMQPSPVVETMHLMNCVTTTSGENGDDTIVDGITTLFWKILESLSEAQRRKMVKLWTVRKCLPLRSQRFEFTDKIVDCLMADTLMVQTK